MDWTNYASGCVHFMKKSNDLNRMSHGDFEKQLERQPLRPVPANWRAEILKASNTAPPSETDGPVLIRFVGPLWRELFVPCRGIWAALAAAWLVILVLNLPGGGKSTRLAVKASPPNRQVQEVLREQKEMLAQFIEPLMPSPAIRPKTPGPRGDLPQTVTVV